MDLTPAFLDRWREHRDLDYLDRVRDVLDEAALDAGWLEKARHDALVREAAATLRHAGIAVDDDAVRAVVDRGATPDQADAGAITAYVAAHRAALAAAEQQAPITPALLDDWHATLSGARVAGAPATGDAASAAPATRGDGTASPQTDGALAGLCAWLGAPPHDLHAAVVAAVAHLELLRLRRWADGNARLARLLLLSLLVRAGHGYRGLLAPSTHWSDPRRLPDRPAQELSPGEAETLPAVEHVVHGIAQALRDVVVRARTEEGGGSLQAMAFGWPIQP
jgi:Fic family protein